MTGVPILITPLILLVFIHVSHASPAEKQAAENSSRRFDELLTAC